jgi:hypothetical protein
LKPAGERIDIYAESLCDRLLATKGFGRLGKRAPSRGCHTRASLFWTFVWGLMHAKRG